MTTLEKYAYQTSYSVMHGLNRAAQLAPGRHYRPEGYNSTRVLTLTLKGIDPAHLKTIMSLTREIGMYAGLSDKQKIRIGWRGTSVVIEIPKPGRYWKLVTVELMKERHFLKRGHIATLGIGLQDEPRRIDFTDAATAHVFITGQTRSGKTNTQRLLTWNLAYNTTPQETKLLIFDVAKKGHNWKDFSGVAHLGQNVITDIETAEKALAWTSLEIERRGTIGQDSPRVFLIIDELRALVEDSEVALPYLARIASVGGEFGIHLVLATQYPQISMLSSSSSGRAAELKRNVTTRLCGKVDDASAALNSVGMPNSGAEALLGYGDFLLKDMTEGLNRLSTAKLEERHVTSLERGDYSIDLPEDTDMIYGGPSDSGIVVPTPQEAAKILSLWGTTGDHAPGLNLLKNTLGGSDKTNRAKRDWVGEMIRELQEAGIDVLEIDNLSTSHYTTTNAKEF